MEAIIRNIRKVEELNLTYRHIKYAIKNTTHRNLMQVQYLTDTMWEMPLDNNELEEKLFSNNTIISHRQTTGQLRNYSSRIRNSPYKKLCLKTYKRRGYLTHRCE